MEEMLSGIVPQVNTFTTIDSDKVATLLSNITL